MTAGTPSPLPAGLEPLRELALDLRWTWSHGADALWRRLSPTLWERTENPWMLLQDLSRERLEQASADPTLMRELHEVQQSREAYLADPGWFGRSGASAGLRGVAFFFMEFGLGEAVPLYAGGLGVLSGDFLKASSDLGVPVVGLGLLYQEGYFRQILGPDLRQLELYPYNDPISLPIEPVESPSGGWLHVALALPGRELLLRIWKATVGRVTLQLIVAGKAHPHDGEGKRRVQEWAELGGDPRVRRHFVFLEDYDLMIAQELVAGVDLWINTPRRPWEACGTSGMKVLVNGGLNLSELDGWWEEAYTPQVGWALGGATASDDPDVDAAEALQLYELLESQIVPEFYARDADGLPRAWIARLRASMAALAPVYSANRMVREYVTRLYLPAAARLRDRAEGGAATARGIREWQERVERGWHSVRFGETVIHDAGDARVFRVHLYLGELTPGEVCVELYADADAPAGAPPVSLEMRNVGAMTGAVHGAIYETTVAADRPAEHFTPRVRPFHPAALVPLEAPQILWQR